jgi:hypothetical protein
MLFKMFKWRDIVYTVKCNKIKFESKNYLFSFRFKFRGSHLIQNGGKKILKENVYIIHSN